MIHANSSKTGANHGHSHSLSDYNRAFAIGVVLNVTFVAVEAGYGVFAHSLALIADAGHNLSDVLTLLLAWGANLLAARTASDKRTYGFRKVTIIASLVSAIVLLFALGTISREAVARLSRPEPIEGLVVILVATFGVVINTATAMLFFSARKKDLNIRGAFLHMVADAGVSLGVAAAGIIIMVKGWLWIDPVITLVIVAVILLGTLDLLRESINHAIDAVPKGIDIAGIREYLTGLENVTLIHDLHVWPLSTTEVALTVHVMVNDELLNNDLLRKMEKDLHDRFGIGHATIQVEKHDADIECMLDRSKCR